MKEKTVNEVTGGIICKKCGSDMDEPVWLHFKCEKCGQRYIKG